MPAKSEKQRRKPGFFGAELSRARSGKKRKTGATVSQIREYARKPKRGSRRTSR